MLKGISPILSPELLKALCEMGHGDELVIADGNFPSHSVGKDAIVIRGKDGLTVEVSTGRSSPRTPTKAGPFSGASSISLMLRSPV